MRQALDQVATLLTGDRADAHTPHWAALRYQHTAAAGAYRLRLDLHPSLPESVL
jgi:hypothetical protein